MVGNPGAISSSCRVGVGQRIRNTLITPVPALLQETAAQGVEQFVAAVRKDVGVEAATRKRSPLRAHG
jgi:hypothetical protein